MLKFIVYISLTYFLLSCGEQIDEPQEKQTVFELSEKIELYQSGEKIGELYKGAKLIYDGGTAEGFQRAVLYMNYYQKPDSNRYYVLKTMDESNIIIPCWNSKDVEPISSK